MFCSYSECAVYLLAFDSDGSASTKTTIKINNNENQVVTPGFLATFPLLRQRIVSAKHDSKSTLTASEWNKAKRTTELNEEKRI